METRYRGRAGDHNSYDLPSHTMDLKFGKTRSSSARAQKSSQEAAILFPKKFSVPITLILIIVSWVFVKFMDSRLPEPLGVKDVSNNPDSFIEERARNDLALLTSLGPRVCGSHANDIAAVELILRILGEIDRVKLPVHGMEIDFQKPTGAFNMGFQEGLTSSYASVPLIAVKLEPATFKANHSILVNCHFDSVPGSPGASDDMINCVTMIEILRVLTSQSTPLKNSVIFLFNGAEENGMQASHGFVAGRNINASGPSTIGHPWAHNLKSFLNLEASGAGGREVLFQTGPGNGWILDSVAQAPYPYGSVVGEEIFQRGLIPSDTDFRVFRDHAKIPGLDMAFIKNGWVYHTRFDNIENIPAGSIQHVGANALAITKHLAGLDYNQVAYTSQAMVYYDAFGLYMIIYSETISILLNLAVGIAAVYFAWREANGDGSTILLHVAGTVTAWIAGIVVAVFVALLLNFFRFYSPFFSYPTLALLLFGIPTVTAQVATFSMMFSRREEETWIASKTTLAFLLLAASFTTRALFTVMINVGFGLVGWILARRLFKDPQRKLICYLTVGELFPLSMSLYLVNNFVDVFVPIMGRSGTETVPNLFVAVLTAVVLSVPTFSGLIPIFVFFKKSFYKISALLFALVLLIIVVGIGRVPYTATTPMRLHLVEVDRTWFDSDLSTVKKSESGFWFFDLDPHVKSSMPLFQESLPELKNLVTYETDKCADLYCGLPYYFPVAKLIRRTQWLKKPTSLPQDLKGRVRMDLIQDSFISQSVRRLTLSFIGPDHMTIVLAPGKSYELLRWSLTSDLPEGQVNFKGRRSYFIYHGRGIQFERFEVTLDLQRRSDHAGGDDSGSALDINFSAFWLHGNEMQSEEMKEFIGAFPDWTYRLGWSAATNIYSIP